MMNICGIFRESLNSLFYHFIEFNENISFNQSKIEFLLKIMTLDKMGLFFGFWCLSKILKECNLLILKANYGTYIDLRFVA